MLNHTVVDLASATVRVRLFGGRSAEDISADMPLLPVTAPGFAPPGPNLVEFARLMGDPTPESASTKGKKKVLTLPPDGPYLTGLVRSLLYQYGTTVRLDVGEDTQSVQFIPGAVADGTRGSVSYGPTPCRLMLVGKCLGFAEQTEGKPFVGPGSAPLWDNWQEAGMPVTTPQTPIYLTNLLKFVPPNQAAGKISRRWVADGLHLLHQEIAAVRPHTILILGADALKALLGNKAKISDYRGRVTELSLDCRPTEADPPDVHVARVVVTDHPAAVSRDTDALPGFIAGLRLCARTVNPPVEQVVMLDHKTIYTTTELAAAVKESVKAAAGGGYLAFDTEWDGHHPSDPGSYVYTVQWSHAPGHARCVFLRRQGGAANPALPLEEAVSLLRRLFCDAPKRLTRLVGHFAKADLPWLASIGVDLYPHFVGPRDDHDPDDKTRFTAEKKCYAEGGFDTYVAAACIDECFPADTLVETEDGPVRIATLVRERLPVKVLSKDQVTGQLVYRPVVEFTKMERSHPIVEVTHTTGLFRCTANHPIWTHNRGYVQAGALAGGDVLCVVWSDFPEAEIAEQQSQVLRSIVLGEVANAPTGAHGEDKDTRSHSQTRSDAKSYRPGVEESGTSRAATQSRGDRQGRSHQEAQRDAQPTSEVSGRERQSSASRSGATKTARRRLAIVGRGPDNRHGETSSYPLQAGCSKLHSEGKRRARRSKPLFGEGPSSRRAEGCLPELPRLVGVPVQEHNVRPFSRASGRDDREVYCLSVDDTHNFFADGVLVSNCQPKKLEILAATLLGTERYDVGIIEWKKAYCAAQKIKQSNLTGYGNVDEHIIGPYAMLDADVAGRLYLYFNGDPREGTSGALDSDRFGNSSRKIFSIRMRAWAAWAEMERYGLGVDVDYHHEKRAVLAAKKDELIARLRDEAQWHEVTETAYKGRGKKKVEYQRVKYHAFTPAKREHLVELLFGEEYLKGGKSVRPPGALSLYLTPYMATDTTGGGKLWDEAIAWCKRKDLPPPSPAANQESVIHLARQHKLVGLLRDIALVSTAMKITFRLPTDVEEWGDEELPPPADWDGEVHEKGLLAAMCGDKRVRSVFGIVETGRASSGGGLNLQNCLIPGLSEYLTDRGWVPIEKLLPTDKVAQFEPSTEAISFVKPLAVVVQHFTGDLVRHETDEQIQLTMTPDHRCLTRSNKRNQIWRTTSALDVPRDGRYYHAGHYVGGSIELSDAEVTFLAAAQADGSWDESNQYMYFRFDKKRKHDRLAAAARVLGMTWTEPKSRTRYNFYFGAKPENARILHWLKATLTARKVYGPWLLEFSRRSLERLAEEMYHWDGLFTRQTETFSSDRESADWMQIVNTLVGVRAHMRPYDNGNPNARTCYIVGMPSRRVGYSYTTFMRKVRIPYDGEVRCVRVPSGYIVVRENMRVSITGNCSGTKDEQIERVLGWGKDAPDNSPERDKKLNARGVFVAPPGWYLVNADLKGAEIFAAGIGSGDKVLLEHARRNNLDENDPEYLDLHSDLANTAFRLNLPLKDVKKYHKPLRVAAKRTRFGHYYGASPETVLRQVLEEEEAKDVTVEQIVAIIQGHDKSYPVLTEYFAGARRRVHTDGWLRNGYGGTRRFRRTQEKDLAAAQEREAQNWLNQGLVADSVNYALGNMWFDMRARNLRSRIVLSVHDSFMIECPPEELELIVDTVLPDAVTKNNPITPTDYAGRPLPRGPYYFGIDVEVGTRWGQVIPEADWRKAAAAARAQISK